MWVEDITEKIYDIWKNENIRTALVQNGHNGIKYLTLENYAKQWENLIEKTLDKQIEVKVW